MTRRESFTAKGRVLARVLRASTATSPRRVRTVAGGRVCRRRVIAAIGAVVFAARPTEAAYPYTSKSDLVTDVNTCLNNVPTGENCCALGHCPNAGTTVEMPYWDVSQVSDMSYLFVDHFDFNVNISRWDVSSVTVMSGMFANARAFNQPLNSWDVSSVTDMSGMFDVASAFNHDITGWSTPSLQSSSWMFNDATAWQASYTTPTGGARDGPPSAWTSIPFANDAQLAAAVSSCANAVRLGSATWETCCSSGPADCGPMDTREIAAWNTAGITNMRELFMASRDFNVDISRWDVSSVTNMEYMFGGARVFNQPLNGWNVSSVTNMGYMFQGATAFNQPLDSWDVSSVTTMENMFVDAVAFDRDITGWSTPSLVIPGGVFNMFGMATAWLAKYDPPSPGIMDGPPSDWTEKIANGGGNSGDAGDSNANGGANPGNSTAIGGSTSNATGTPASEPIASPSPAPPRPALVADDDSAASIRNRAFATTALVAAAVLFWSDSWSSRGERRPAGSSGDLVFRMDGRKRLAPALATRHSPLAMRSTLPRICAFTLALCCLVVSAAAQTYAALDTALEVKEAAVATLKADIEFGAAEMHNGTLQNWATDDCEIYSSCSSSLQNPRCDPNFGNTVGCDCNGRTIDYSAAVVKTSPKLGAPAHKVKKTACLAKHAEGNLTSLYTSLIEQGDGKWVYFGSDDGVLFNFPGFVWDTSVGDAQCGVDYDSRLRPWQMTAATGPKNVVLILDISASMGLHGRLESMKTAAKKVVDAMTFADYVGVVLFNDEAVSMNDYSILLNALPAFRVHIKSYIDGLLPVGGTNFIAGFEKAFDLVDESRSRSHAADCHTTYVFLTDGEALSPASTIQSRQSTVSDEHYFIVSLGSGPYVDVLRQLSWDIGGIFSAVPDYEEEELQRALIGFYKYYALQKTLGKVEGYSWTDPYDSIPMIWGPMTSVSAPVYDKTREPWHMIGVASVEATMCDLEAKAPVGPTPPDPPQTERDCTCEPSWTYAGQTFEGCSDVDWPVPWCAVQVGCGYCGLESVGPTGCWDNCKPTGSEATLRAELLDRATSWCAPTNASNLPSCALEALRISIDGQASSSHSCSSADLAYYKWAIDGEDDPVAGGTVFNLERTEGPVVGTGYDMDTGNCQCDESMTPTCACAATLTNVVDSGNSGDNGGSNINENGSGNPNANAGSTGTPASEPIASPPPAPPRPALVADDDSAASIRNRAFATTALVAAAVLLVHTID